MIDSKASSRRPGNWLPLALSLFSLACEPPVPPAPPAAPLHQKLWFPSELEVVPGQLVSDKTGHVAFEISSNNWVYANDKAVLHIEPTRILDPSGNVLAQIGPEGVVTFTGVGHVAHLTGSYVDPPGSSPALAKLHFSDTDLVIFAGGRVMLSDASAPTPFPKFADAHFAHYDPRGATLYEVVFALLIVPKAKLDREPTTNAK